ncbi:hypothetical protein FCV25MIE_34500, partial [Fagus crenata]
RLDLTDFETSIYLLEGFDLLASCSLLAFGYLIMPLSKFKASFKFRSLDLQICGFDLLANCSHLAFGHSIMPLSKFTLNEILKDPPR